MRVSCVDARGVVIETRLEGHAYIESLIGSVASFVVTKVQNDECTDLVITIRKPRKDEYDG